MHCAVREENNRFWRDYSKNVNAFFFVYSHSCHCRRFQGLTFWTARRASGLAKKITKTSDFMKVKVFSYNLIIVAKRTRTGILLIYGKVVDSKSSLRILLYFDALILLSHWKMYKVWAEIKKKPNDQPILDGIKWKIQESSIWCLKGKTFKQRDLI